MMENVSPGIRTFAALGLLAGLLLLVINLAASPLSHRWTALEMEIRAMREQAGEMQAIAADIGAARDAVEQAARALGSIGYLPGDTEAVQLANLQTRIVGIAQRTGLRPQSTRTLATRKISASSSSLWLHHWPFTELYAVITHATPSSTMRLKCGR